MKYRIKNVIFSCDEMTGKSQVLVLSHSSAGAEIECKECISEDNPKIAFNMFMSRVSYTLWAELADKLEQYGINRHTGELMNNEPQRTTDSICE